MNRKERQRVEEEELIRRSREQLGLEQVAESLCPKHLWRPMIRVGALPPPPSQCPGCLEDATRAHDATERPTRTIVHPGMPQDSKGWDLYEHWKELERKRHSGRVEPGSPEEQEALERMDAAREEAKIADRPRERGGVLVSQRVEQGVLVEYRAIRGRGIVKVV